MIYFMQRKIRFLCMIRCFFSTQGSRGAGTRGRGDAEGKKKTESGWRMAESSPRMTEDPREWKKRRARKVADILKKIRGRCDMASLQPSKAVSASAAGGVLRLQIGGG
jgi:hypothetical protein